MSCSPHRAGKYKEGCLSAGELKKVIKEHNKTSPHKKIPVHKKDRSTLHKSLQESFEDCKDSKNTEVCILKKLNVLQQFRDKYRPMLPSHWKQDERAWLSNFDILEVMNQYEKKYKNFKFLGVFSIDFQDHTCTSTPGICNFVVAEQKKKKFAMVLNLSKHNEAGSHWVTIYIDINPKSIHYGMYYYDSGGLPETREVKRFYNNVKEQLSGNNKIPFAFFYNDNIHQNKDTECGVFCMNFLIKCLENSQLHVKHIEKEITLHQTHKNDDKIHVLRKELYNEI